MLNPTDGETSYLQGPKYRYSTVGSFKLQFSLSFVTSCYVIMNISIAWTIDKLKIT